jgi:hypothetical protein
MDISQLARKPQLIKLELTDADFIETYGEPITFYIRDHIDLSTYFDFYKVQQTKEDDLLQQIFRKLILKEDGTPSIPEDSVLPVNISLAILLKINEHLGKSDTKPLTPMTGESQK